MAKARGIDPIWWWVGGGVLALLALGGAAVGAKWILANRGIILSDTQRRFVDRVAAKLPKDFPLTVNSGYRSPDRQAAAMIAKRADWRRSLGAEAGDRAFLREYGNSWMVQQLVEKPEEEWGYWIAQQVAGGHLISDHLRSDAIDFGIRELSPIQRKQLVAAARAAGARNVAEEAHPPHIHADTLS